MKKEIEVKFFIDSLDEVRRKLRKLSAEFMWAGAERDVFLDTDSGFLNKKDTALRVRDSYQKLLTLKEAAGAEKGGDFKVRRETEIEVSDIRSLIYILGRLGLKPRFRYVKPLREYWRYRGSSVTLDSFPFGKFVEVEGSRSEIRLIARRLGLDFARSSNKSYRQLLAEYKRKRKI